MHTHIDVRQMNICMYTHNQRMTDEHMYVYTQSVFDERTCMHTHSVRWTDIYMYTDDHCMTDGHIIIIIIIIIITSNLFTCSKSQPYRRIRGAV